MHRPWYLAVIAEVHGHLGQADVGIALLNEALDTMAIIEDRWWEPELCRLKGDLLLACSADNQLEAEHCFRKALDVAQKQGAKSLELRAAIRLSRLWQQQGKRRAAHDLLAPVYQWFTEGFDTADLKDAKALLDELA
jgi:predicted ATPase